MPRAENRKRPPNLSSGGRSGHVGQVQGSEQKAAETIRSQNKKQELIERMKQAQAKKDNKPSE